MRYPFLLVVILALLASPALHAGTVTFDRYKFSVAIPDSSWSWDTLATGRGNDESRLVLRASDTTDARRITVTILDDPHGAAAHDDELAHAFIEMLIREQHAVPRDTSYVSVGGIRGVRLVGELPSEELGEAPFAMVMVCANEHAYVIFTGLDGGKPEYDPVLEGIVHSFTFIGEPTHVDSDQSFPDEPGTGSSSPALKRIVTAGIVFVAIAIPAVVIILLVQRRNRRKAEEAEREWERL